MQFIGDAKRSLYPKLVKVQQYHIKMQKGEHNGRSYQY